MSFPRNLYMARSSLLVDLAEYWIECGCCSQITKRPIKIYSDKSPRMTFEKFEGRLRCSVCGKPPAHVLIDEAYYHRPNAEGSQRFIVRGDPAMRPKGRGPDPKPARQWKAL